MMKKKINQKNILLIEYYKMLNLSNIISNKPINRLQKKKFTNKIYNKELKIDILKKEITNIKNCDLKKKSKKIVFADGDINSKIMIINDYPNEIDEKEGFPLSKKSESGLLFDKMIKAINFDRSDLYITNVINFKTPNNRKPTSDEISKYKIFLKSHIEIINPSILILLGSIPLQAIFGEDKLISKERGKWFNKEIGTCKTNIISTFHPTFLINQQEQKKKSWFDLKLIRDKFNLLR